MQHDLEPDPSFVEHLEWQLRSALRRTDRFARPARRSIAWLRSAALVVASLALGAAGVVAAERIQDSRERTLFAQRAEIQIELARSRLARAEGSAQRAEALHARGFASASDLNEAKVRVAAARGALARLELELDELLATSRPPSDEVDAPVVHGRDYVSERLELELDLLRLRRDALVAETERAQKLVEAGFASRGELDRVAAQARPVEARVAASERLLALRRSVVTGGVDLADAPRLAARIGAEERLGEARELAAIAERRAAEIEDAAAAGRVDAETLAQARAAFEDARAGVEIAELELELVEERMGR